MEEKKFRRTAGFVIQRSNGDDIKIDQEELDGVLEACGKGAIIVVKRGIIPNPNFISGIIPDKNRMQEWARECNYTDGSGMQARHRGLKPLKSVFAGTKTKIEQALLQKQKEVEKLETKKPKKLDAGK